MVKQHSTPGMLPGRILRGGNIGYLHYCLVSVHKCEKRVRLEGIDCLKQSANRLKRTSAVYLIKWCSVWCLSTHDVRPDSSITASSSREPMRFERPAS